MCTTFLYLPSHLQWLPSRLTLTPALRGWLCNSTSSMRPTSVPAGSEHGLHRLLCLGTCPQLAALLGKEWEMWPWRRCVTGVWGFSCLAQATPSVGLSMTLTLPHAGGSRCELLATAPAPGLPAAVFLTWSSEPTQLFPLSVTLSHRDRKGTTTLASAVPFSLRVTLTRVTWSPSMVCTLSKPNAYPLPLESWHQITKILSLIDNTNVFNRFNKT